MGLMLPFNALYSDIRIPFLASPRHPQILSSFMGLRCKSSGRGFIRKMKYRV